MRIGKCGHKYCLLEIKPYLADPAAAPVLSHKYCLLEIKLTVASGFRLEIAFGLRLPSF